MRWFALPVGLSAREQGRSHGESFRGEIQSLADLRSELTIERAGLQGRDQLAAVAREHLPVLAAFDDALHEELMGIAEGAGITPEDVVVLNHYTDIRDISSEHAGDADDDCSVVYVKTSGGSILAQTWDMHATAMPFVMMLKVPAIGDAPAAWLLSLTGCLGMAGLNARGLAMAINNLHSTDARVGLVWPALVRRVMRETAASAARDLVMTSPLGSGHHYVVASPSQVFGIETSGSQRHVIYEGTPATYVHTNHCVEPRVAAHSRIPAGSTTLDRYHWLSRSLGAKPIESMADAWRVLGSQDGYPRSICTNMATAANPHGTATCGGIAMQLDSGEIWAAAGLTHNVDAERFAFDSGEL